MAWDDWLTITETLEDQLYLEIQARMLAEITDFDYLLDIAVNYQRQNWQKDEIIKNCIAKIIYRNGSRIYVLCTIYLFTFASFSQFITHC